MKPKRGPIVRLKFNVYADALKIKPNLVLEVVRDPLRNCFKLEGAPIFSRELVGQKTSHGCTCFDC